MNFYLDDSAYHIEIEKILSNKDLIEKNKDFKKHKLLRVCFKLIQQVHYMFVMEGMQH